MQQSPPLDAVCEAPETRKVRKEIRRCAITRHLDASRPNLMGPSQSGHVLKWRERSLAVATSCFRRTANRDRRPRQWPNLRSAINYEVRQLKRRRGAIIKPAFRGKVRGWDNYGNRQNGGPRRLKQCERGSRFGPLACTAEKMLPLGLGGLGLRGGYFFNFRTLHRESRGETRRKRADGKNKQRDPAPRPQPKLDAKMFWHYLLKSTLGWTRSDYTQATAAGRRDPSYPSYPLTLTPAERFGLQ